MPPPNNPLREFDELYATKNEKDTIVYDLEAMYLDQKKQNDDSRFKEELGKLGEELKQFSECKFMSFYNCRAKK